VTDQRYWLYVGRWALVGAIVLLTSGPLHAHDYWFDRDGTDYVLLRGHRHAKEDHHHHHGHGETAVVPYAPTIVRKIVCIEPAGARRQIAAAADYPARIAGPCASVLARVDTGYWSKTSSGTKNLPRHELTGVERSWRAVESVKVIEAWHEDLARPLGNGLELVSTTDPFAIRPGRKLRLLVTYQGQPRAGVAVAYDDTPRGVTGADGRINIRVRHGGPQRITASVDEPLRDDQVDTLVRSTKLFFTVPEDD